MNTQTTQLAAENNKANYFNSSLNSGSFMLDPDDDDDDELDIPLDDEIDTFGDFDDDDDEF
ncbi:MAG: hypothetical protein JWN56_1592 [Sphingobacteriales bacterium]|nr:hypothetical protein [Sphingobacteriales bacterium]